MTYATGAAGCLRLGGHRWRKTDPGIEVCGRCDAERLVAYTDDELDAFDARDAGIELNRAEAEAFDLWASDSEREYLAHREER